MPTVKFAILIKSKHLLVSAFFSAAIWIGISPALAGDDNIPPVWLVRHYNFEAPNLPLKMKNMRTCFHFLMSWAEPDDDIIWATLRSNEYGRETKSGLEKELKDRKMKNDEFAKILARMFTKHGECIRTDVKK